MTLYTDEENFLKDVQNCGFMLAGLFCKTVDWALEKAKYPVKIALRDGEPIFHVAKQILNLSNDKRFEKLKDWQTIWITHSISSAVLYGKNTKIKQYFSQVGMDEPFTFLDTGFIGNIPCNLNQEGRKFQTFFMCASNEYFDDFVKSEKLEMFKDLQLHNFCPQKSRNCMFAQNCFSEIFCLLVLESIPKQFYKVNVDNFEQENGIVTVKPNLIDSEIKQKAYKQFYIGLDQGIELFLNSGIEAEYFLKLFEASIGIINVLSVFHNGGEKSNMFNFCKEIKLENTHEFIEKQMTEMQELLSQNER